MKKAENRALRLHPSNPKVFEFRGNPLVMMTATEHYGAVLNRPFRFDRYLADAGEKGMTATRLFLLFREQQSAQNPYSTCKPESPDYISPFPRVGPELAIDGQPKYDLDRWNPEFFDRLHRFLSMAGEHGIIVEVTLLSNTYDPGAWSLNPLHAANNINNMEWLEWPDYLSMRHPKLFARQCAHVRKIVEETNRYDNIFYEICNEPGGAVGPNHPTCAEVNQWQTAIADLIRKTESTLPNQHLIAGQEAFAYRLEDESRRAGPDVHQFADQSFDSMSFDFVNMHPLSNMIYRDHHYDLGQFMRARLRMPAFRQYCLDLFKEHKPLSMDEDNSATQYKDVRGWTIHRKRAWTALMCGAHYSCIDFSIINYCETGTADSQRYFRTPMGLLARFIHTVDLVHARPMPDLIKRKPPEVLDAVLGIVGQDYCIYLADQRESEEPGAGSRIRGSIELALPAGAYTIAAFSPLTGLYSPALPLAGGPLVHLQLPEFEHDILLRIRRDDASR